MNLSELTIIQNLPENQRKAILELIDTKINNDMKEVIHAVEALGIRFDELKRSTDSRLIQMQESIDLQLSQIKESIRILYWILGIIGSGVVAGITIYLATIR